MRGRGWGRGEAHWGAATVGRCSSAASARLQRHLRQPQTQPAPSCARPAHPCRTGWPGPAAPRRRRHVGSWRRPRRGGTRCAWWPCGRAQAGMVNQPAAAPSPTCCPASALPQQLPRAVTTRALQQPNRPASSKPTPQHRNALALLALDGQVRGLVLGAGRGGHDARHDDQLRHIRLRLPGGKAG